MESTGQTAIGVFIVVVSAVMIAVSRASSDGLVGLLPFVGNALAGAMFVLAGIGRSVEVGGRTIARPQLIGWACVVLGICFAPFVVDAFDGSVASRVWGVAAGVGAATIVWIGASYLTGRVEPAT